MAINSSIVPGNADMLVLKQLRILLQCADPFAAWTGPVCAASLPTASVSLTHQAAQFSKLCWRTWQQCNLLVALGGSPCLLRCLADCLLVHSTGNNAPIHLQSPAEACARQCKLPKGVVYVWLVASYSGCDSNGSHAGNTACTILSCVLQVCCQQYIRKHGYETSYSCLAKRAAKTNNVWNRIVRKGCKARRLCMFGEPAPMILFFLVLAAHGSELALITLPVSVLTMIVDALQGQSSLCSPWVAFCYSSPCTIRFVSPASGR